MLIFWLGVCVMIVVALFFVLRPLFHRKLHQQGSDQTETELAVYHNRMAELKAEVDNGLLSESEAAMVEIELKKTLLHEAEDNRDHVAPFTKTGTRNWWAMGVVSVLLPVSAISIYMSLGNPHLADTSSRPPPVNSDNSDMHQLSIDKMVDNLAERLEKNPDDPQGWMMLTNSYMALGRYRKAAEAAERMYALVGEEANVMLRYADALAMANNGRLSGKPAELVKKALVLDPDNTTGLWLAGMVEEEQGNYAEAIEYWQRLQPLLENDQDSLTELNQLISRAQGQIGGSQQKPVPDETKPETGDMPKSIVVDVSLSPDFADDADPEDALFVYARAIEGPPMPLAVVRKKVKDLPLQVTLDDSLAMFPQMKLSNFDQVKISARVSKTGNAKPQSGDFFGETPAIINNKKPDPVSIIINRQIP